MSKDGAGLIKSSGIGWLILGALSVLIVFAELLSGIGFNQQDANSILLSPSSAHFFGTDSLGRDLFTRIFVGGRNTLVIALTSSVLALGIGVTVGMLIGWVGGRFDRWLLRSIDVLQSIPNFLTIALLCVYLQSVWGDWQDECKHLLSLIISICLVHWFNIAKITRGLTKKIKALAYIEAATALGASPVTILLKHVLPNMHSTIVLLFVLQIPNSIVYESMITFAGFGLQSPQVSWGMLLQEGWRTLAEFPHLLLLPGLVLFLTILGFHLVSRRRP